MEHDPRTDEGQDEIERMNQEELRQRVAAARERYKILRFFDIDHLPPHLQATAALVGQNRRGSRELFRRVARYGGPLPARYRHVVQDARLKLARLTLADDDVDDTTESGRAHLLCEARWRRSFRAPLNKEPSSKAAKSVDDVTHVSSDDIAAAASFCLRSASLRNAAMQSGARSKSWTAFTRSGSMGLPLSNLLRGSPRSWKQHLTKPSTFRRSSK